MNCAIEIIEIQNDSKKKRKTRKALTLAERISVIKKQENVKSSTKLAKIFGCGRTQILSILKNKKLYLDQWNGKADLNKIRHVRLARHMILGIVVNEWLQRSRKRGIQIKDSQILKAGQGVSKLMHLKDFRSTKSWLNQLKKMFKIISLEPIYEYIGPKKSLNLMDILLELQNNEDELRMRLPQYMFNALYSVGFDQITKEQITNNLSEDDSISVGETLASAESDYGSTEIDIAEECKHIVSSKIELSNKVIEDKSKTGNEQLSTKDVTSDIENDEMQIELGKTGEVIDEKKILPTILSYREALDHLRPIEQFLLCKADIRAIGIMNQLENLFTERTLSNSE